MGRHGDGPPSAPGEAAPRRESPTGQRVYWFLKDVALGPLVRRIFRPIVTGTHHIPAKGPVILAGNHLSYLDWVFTPLVLSRRVTFVAKSDYFDGSGLKGWLQKRFFAGTGQVPIDRSGGKVSEGALRAGLKVLGRGGIFGIYPEGTRSPDGKLYKGRTGVARLALVSGAPVVPTAIVHTDVIAPTGRILSKVVRPEVHFGAPLDFSRYAGGEDDRVILRAITDEIMVEIRKMSRQEYVDDYATNITKPTPAAGADGERPPEEADSAPSPDSPQD